MAAPYLPALSNKPRGVQCAILPAVVRYFGLRRNPRVSFRRQGTEDLVHPQGFLP